ncbi:MAG: LAGLIDADG family homing endonuclease [Nitrososphaerota archaeon]
MTYVIGVIAGDGYVWRRQRPRKSYHGTFIGLNVVDREFAEEFSKCFAIVGREPTEPRWDKRRFVVELECKALYELPRKSFNMEEIKKFIEHDRECKSAFLRGFFDREGCVSKRGEVNVYNTNFGLLGYVTHLLSSLSLIHNVFGQSGVVLLHG